MWYVILVLFLTLFVSMLSYHLGKRYSVVDRQEPSQNRFIFEETFVNDYETNDDAINVMINHAPFACFCVSRDLVIQRTVNRAAEKMFETNVLNQRVSDVLFEKQPVLQSSFDAMIISLFDAVNEKERNSILQMMPQKVVCFDKTISLGYHFDQIHGFFIYISDISKVSNALEDANKKIAELDMVIQVLKNQKNYIDLKMQLSRLNNEEIEHVFTFGEDINTVKNFMRHKLHSFMLSAVSLGLRNSVTKIEYLEESLDRIPQDTSVIQMRDKLYSLGVARIIEEDRKIIASHIDEEKLDARYFTVDHEAISEIELMINALPKSDQKDVLMRRFKTIKFVNIVDIVARFDKYALDLSKKLGKKINPIQYMGEKVLIDEALFKDIIVGFIELVTNALDHGIEFPADRFRIGKSEHGNLTLKFAVEEKGYRVEFIDDGKGVDINEIKNNLYETKRFSFDDVVQMTDSEVLETIFLDGVFNMNVTSRHFNKGTGLFLLKEKIAKMGGTITVSTKQNVFTAFEIYIPLRSTDS